MTHNFDNGRRHLLRRSALVAAVAGIAVARPARAALGGARSLALEHTHTGERIERVFAVDERYDDTALAALNHFLRDHYTGEASRIDPRLFDQLHRLRQLLGGGRAFQVISGYRCPATNTRLRATRGGGVARQSLHVEGRAIDVRLPGTALADLRDAALALRAGGVGFYAHQQFVHLDTGRVRNW